MSSARTIVLPEKQKAIKIQGANTLVVDENAPVPIPGPGMVLVKVVCVALNPVDWKSADLSPSVGATWGIDFSGKLVGAADDVDSFNVGDAVFGSAFGNNPDDASSGAFAEYLTIPAELTFKKPTSLSFEQAATLGTGIATAGLALFQTLRLPWPGQVASNPEFVLVQGAGTASGTMMIQLLKLSGLIPIATCSPMSARRVQGLGATQVFDYNDPSCGLKIKNFTNDSLAYCVDCISSSASMRLCYEAISSAGGKYVSLDPFQIKEHTRRRVKPSWIIGFTIYGQRVNWKRPYYRDARPQDREFGVEFFKVVQTLLDAGQLENHPFRVGKGGLQGLIAGARLAKEGKNDGKKMVYQVLKE